MKKMLLALSFLTMGAIAHGETVISPVDSPGESYVTTVDYRVDPFGTKYAITDARKILTTDCINDLNNQIRNLKSQLETLNAQLADKQTLLDQVNSMYSKQTGK